MQTRSHRVRAPAPGRDPRAFSPPSGRTPLACRGRWRTAWRRCAPGRPAATRRATWAGRGRSEFGGGGATGRRADHHRPGAGGRRRAGVRQRRRTRRARAVAAALRHRRAAPPPHPGDPRGRGDLVPGVLRAGRRVGPRVAADARRGPRRPLRGQRAEDLGLVGAVRPLVRRAGPDERRRAPGIAGSRC